MIHKNNSVLIESHTGPNGESIALFYLDMPNKSANVLTTELFNDIAEAWKVVEQGNFAGAVILSAKEKIFVAGADLVAISKTLDWPDERIHQFCEDGRNIFRRFRSNDFPTVAAVHGACVGGGFELTLWCDFRIAADDRRTIFGLPEVKLGLVPGWAGTCLTPRLCGVEPAAEWISLARNLSAAEAFEAGVVSSVVEKERLIEEATRLIVEQNSSRAFLVAREKMEGPASSPSKSVDEIRKNLLTRIHRSPDVDNHAAEIVMDQVLDTWNADLNSACHGESLAMAKVYGSDQSAGLLNSFFLNDRARKSGNDLVANAAAKEIRNVAIVGCGQMGSGIAEQLAKAGFDLCLFDAELSASKHCEEALQAKFPDRKIVAVEQIASLSECDLFIESVLENLPVKREILQSLDSIARTDAILATNTSVIELRQLEDAVSHPNRFMGLHFCSPVSESGVVELVRGDQTDEATLAATIQLARKIRKHPVVVKDGPGFVINRILGGMFDEANRMLMDGTDYLSIDQAIREFGFPAGPFEIMDVIGNDVVYHAGKSNFTFDKDRVFLSPVQPKMVKKKFLGCKNGIGYYNYKDFDLRELPFKQAPQNEAAVALIEQYREPKNSLTPDEIQMRILLMMLRLACDVLDSKLVDDPRDIDICLQFGIRFPGHHGGLLFWADWKGIDLIVGSYESFQRKICKDRFATPDRLLKMKENGSRFYDG